MQAVHEQRAERGDGLELEGDGRSGDDEDEQDQPTPVRCGVETGSAEHSAPLLVVGILTLIPPVGKMELGQLRSALNRSRFRQHDAPTAG